MSKTASKPAVKGPAKTTTKTAPKAAPKSAPKPKKEVAPTPEPVPASRPATRSASEAKKTAEPKPKPVPEPEKAAPKRKAAAKPKAPAKSTKRATKAKAKEPEVDAATVPEPEPTLPQLPMVDEASVPEPEPTMPGLPVVEQASVPEPEPTMPELPVITEAAVQEPELTIDVDEVFQLEMAASHEASILEAEGTKNEAQEIQHDHAPELQDTLMQQTEVEPPHIPEPVATEADVTTVEEFTSPVHPGLDSYLFEKDEDFIMTDDEPTLEPEAAPEEAPMPSLSLFPAPTLSRPTDIPPVFNIPEVESPIKSILRSPLKKEESPSKKTVTFNTHPYSAVDILVTDGPLTDTLWFLDVNSTIHSRRKSENHIFVGLLEDLGAQVMYKWEKHQTPPTHVLFKDGATETLEKVVASNGTVKCVNVGFALDCEKHNKRMDESDYLVDLKPARVIKTPSPVRKRLFFTPARTPSHLFATPSTILSTPTTPTSSEYNRSIIYSDVDDKENTTPSPPAKPVQQSAPAKPQSMFSWLNKSPIKPMTVARPMASAARKRRFESIGGITMAPPKKLRFE
jgi:hypothetical protein